MFPEYYDQRTNRIVDYLNFLEKNLQRLISEGGYDEKRVIIVSDVTTSEGMGARKRRMEENYRKCMREFRGALPPYLCGY